MDGLLELHGERRRLERLAVHPQDARRDLRAFGEMIRQMVANLAKYVCHEFTNLAKMYSARSLGYTEAEVCK